MASWRRAWSHYDSCTSPESVATLSAHGHQSVLATLCICQTFHLRSCLLSGLHAYLQAVGVSTQDGGKNLQVHVAQGQELCDSILRYGPAKPAIAPQNAGCLAEAMHVLDSYDWTTLVNWKCAFRLTTQAFPLSWLSCHSSAVLSTNIKCPVRPIPDNY